MLMACTVPARPEVILEIVSTEAPGVVPMATQGVVLTEAQIEMFLATMEALDAKTQTGFSACIIEPHHTIAFFAGSKLTSTMHICFKCNQVSWDATTATPPEGLYEGLRIFIKAIGMQPSRDWKLLASERQPE